MVELDQSAEFDAARDTEFFAALPEQPAVFTVAPRAELAGAGPYLLRTANLRQRLTKLLGPPEAGSKRLNLRTLAAGIRFRVAGSPFELSYLHWQQARRLQPATYRDHLRMRPAAMLKVSVTNAYPRCYPTRRIGSTGFYFGPFASRRAAEAFASGFLDLFQIRRCQIKIRRDPNYPGCIYSEMKLCMAPCYAGCTAEEYRAETERVVAFLATQGASLTAEFEREREAASASLDFERAATIHRRIEKAGEALRAMPELARRVQDWNAVVLQRATQANAVTVFAVREGHIEEPRTLRFVAMASESRSVEQILRDWLEPPGPGSAASSAAGDSSTVSGAASQTSKSIPSATSQYHRELEDHLALLARWFYAKPRVGEIFFREGTARSSSAATQDAASARRNSEWPYRRILRACARLLTPPESTPQSR